MTDLDKALAEADKGHIPHYVYQTPGHARPVDEVRGNNEAFWRASTIQELGRRPVGSQPILVQQKAVHLVGEDE